MTKCILEVINDEAPHPVEYAAAVKDRKLSDAIGTALCELGLDVGLDPATVAEIYCALRDGGVYWLEETHCFCTVQIDV